MHMHWFGWRVSHYIVMIPQHPFGPRTRFPIDQAFPVGALRETAPVRGWYWSALRSGFPARTMRRPVYNHRACRRVPQIARGLRQVQWPRTTYRTPPFLFGLAPQSGRPSLTWAAVSAFPPLPGCTGAGPRTFAGWGLSRHLSRTCGTPAFSEEKNQD